MEASAVPREAPAGRPGILTPRMLRVASDARLVGWIRQGRAAAFEVLYDRHHRSILAFCHHMLGSLEEAEDAAQHTFLVAFNELAASEKPIQLRAWLFTIARNRCYSLLRRRREQPLAELAEPTTEGLATLVQRRQDLRDLVGDMRRLPDDQRAALVLAEMDALSHEQIGAVLGVPTPKVKALVFQARESLLASRTAREADCAEIREQLANLRGGALRRTHLRRHLRDCPGCREFRKQVDRQRRQLRVLLPVGPAMALKQALLPASGGGTAAGGLLTSSAVKGVTLIGAVLAGVGAAGTIVTIHDSLHVWPALRAPHVRVVGAPHSAAEAIGASGSSADRVVARLRAGDSSSPSADQFARLELPGSHQLAASFGDESAGSPGLLVRWAASERGNGARPPSGPRPSTASAMPGSAAPSRPSSLATTGGGLLRLARGSSGYDSMRPRADGPQASPPAGYSSQSFGYQQASSSVSTTARHAGGSGGNSSGRSSSGGPSSPAAGSLSRSGWGPGEGSSVPTDPSSSVASHAGESGAGLGSRSTGDGALRR